MEHIFNTAFNNLWHYTIESILPIVDHIDEIMSGDIVVVPDYESYPINLIERFFRNKENILVERRPQIEVGVEGGYLWNDTEKVKLLCQKLLCYVDKQDVKRPSIFMSFRLHNRRWLPIENIQNLVDKLNTDGYTVMLCLNPKWEGNVELPEFINVIQVYNESYVTQLSYAASADYSIYMNGANMIFPQICNIPSVLLTPCLTTETNIIDINSHEYPNKKITVLSDKIPWNGEELWRNWYADVENVTVDQVLESFKSIIN